MASIPGLVIADALASRRGIQDSDALNRIRIIGAVVGASPIGIIVSDVVAQREAQNIVAAPTTPTAPAPPKTTQTMVQVPDVTGKAVADAQTQLTSLGLQSQRQDVISSTTAKDIVIAQTPKGGETVAKGTVVILSVSLGVLVPDVHNLSLADATARLQNIGLQVQSVNERNSTVPKDAVISQDPAAGSPVSPGSTVTLTVSLGANVTVPNVVDKRSADAQKALQDAGLQIKLAYEPSGAINKDFVIRQDPAAGASVPFGTVVTLTISTGQDFALPDVTGKSFGDAQKQLQDLKLQVKREDQASDAVAEGFVIRQDPVAGTLVSPNSLVTLFVSTGVPTADLPDVRKQLFKDARETLQDLDFIIKRVDVASDQPEGTVIDQDPKPGKVPPETTVTLSVSTGKGPVV